MQEIYVENTAEVMKNKNRLQKELNVKISNKGKLIFVEGSAENEFLTIDILNAINYGFSMECSLKLKQEDALFQTLNIKDITKRQDLERVRARIIGTQGKTLKTLQKITNCDFSLHDNKIGIIGDALDVEDGIQAITSIVQGSKQGNVYARAERQKKKKRLENKGIDSEMME